MDLGARRVGLALSDPGNLAASPYRTLEYKGLDSLVESLQGVVQAEGVSRVVVGLPVREDGQEGEGCRQARAMAERLVSLGVEAVLWDERYSSLGAEEALRSAGLKRKKALRRGAVDRVAAALILRDYLDTNPG